jgi:hypothetical protein
MARTIGFTLAITAIAALAVLHALIELALSTRPRLEAWQANRAYGTSRYPKGWRVR